MAKRKRPEEPSGTGCLIGVVAVIALFVSLKLRISFLLAVALVVGVPVLLVVLWVLVKTFAPEKRPKKLLPTKSRGETIVVDTPEALEEFRRTHTVMESRILKVKGVTFCNADGQSRQPIVARCHRGDPVEVRFERYNGDPAYAVWTDYGQIGHLPADEARRIYDTYGDDAIFCGTVDAVLGGYDGLNYGCDIRLEIYT